MKKFGLLGEKLSHSYSPVIHKMLGDYEYSLFEKSPDELSEFFNKKEFDGLNVTIPYKKEAVSFCDFLTGRAKSLGSVNTIVKMADGKLLGHNTDYYGFEYLVKQSGISVKGKKATVLGSGGASVTVCAVFKDMGAESVTVISRSGEDNYDNINRHYDADIIVNATPVGMYPNNGKSAIKLENFKNCSCVFDLIYNPSKTALLLDAESLGIKNLSGLSMLAAQAKESGEYFTGEKIDESKITEITAKLSADMKNIILIGMPGCGKSTVGKILSLKLKRDFFDVDEYIVDKEKMSIPEIFEKRGEEGFRKLETEALSELCKKSACVIATGGGCVTREENYELLHQNGFVFWLLRDINLLPGDGRPLSIGANMEKMFEKRKPFYEKFADFKVENSGQCEETADKIVRCIYENNGN